jgi:hypothetical protein
MRTLEVIVPLPCEDLSSRVEEVPEPAYVQALVAQPAVEALDIGILDWLAGLDVDYVDAPLDRSGEEVA